MKERLKILWNSRPRVGRRLQTVCFLMLAVFFLCELWGYAGYLLPTAEMEFRRSERTQLMDLDGTLYRFTIAGEDRIISVSDNWVNVGWEKGGGTYGYPVEPEGTLLPLWNMGGGKKEHGVLALGLPDEVVSARLELNLAAGCYEWFQSDVTGENKHLILLGEYHEKNAEKYTYRHFKWDYQMEGEQLDNGLFLFRVYPHDQIENNITGEVKGLAEWKALDEIRAEYLSHADNRGLTELVLCGTFYDKDGNVVRELRLAPLESLE